MANVKKAVQEEVTEKEIPRAAYEGVLTIDVDALSLIHISEPTRH